jgi:hypothetical protein
VNARGVGAIVMSLADPATFPSVAYAQVRGGEVPGVHGDVEHAHLEQLGTSALARRVRGRVGHGTEFAAPAASTVDLARCGQAR